MGSGRAQEPVKQRREFRERARTLELPHPAKTTALAAKETEERRTLNERRDYPRAKEAASPDPKGYRAEHKFYLPKSALSMALFLAIAFVVATAGELTPAKGLPGIAAGLSVAIFLLGQPLASVERLPGMPHFGRLGLLCIGVVAPMGLAGFALGEWFKSGLPLPWAIATVVCVNAAAASLYTSRIISLFAGKISIWAAFVLVSPSDMLLIILAGTSVAFFIIACVDWNSSEKRRLEREARERVGARAEDILRSFEESGHGWFWETDRRGLLSYVSPSVADTLNKPVEDLLGSPLSALVDFNSKSGESKRTLAFHISARSAFHEIEMRAAGVDEERWWSITGRPVYDAFNNFCGFRGHGSDLTEKRRSEQQVTRLAHFDSLTGLANRVQMSQTLERILAAPRERDRSCAVLMIDLDRFKQVNDTLGHPAGDALLKQVAMRLERAVAGKGRCGRLGGDEFEVIIPGADKRENLTVLATQIIRSLSQPYTIEGHNVVIGASVGIVVAPEDGLATDALTRNVDLALYAAKDAGRGCCRFYADDLHSAAEERADLEKDLRNAIHTGELELYYQPVVHAASERIVGFEALMRWNHPIKGWMSPAKFIPIAEDAGLIDQLGQWALRTACDDLAKWPESVRCAVNVSPLQFAKPELPSIVANALAHADVAPSRLELEITESVFLNDTAGTDAMFRALKNVGVRLALDDFGTGYSSLGYLKKAPFDKIKIDQSFVRGATESDSRNGAIISSITSLAEALNMDTTAEGVETVDELDLIRLLGCSHVQGYIYHKPMNCDDATELVSGDLAATPEGPQAARSPRQVLLRRVTVLTNGSRLNATIRNISEGGAMIEGLWNLTSGTQMTVEFSAEQAVEATVRWTNENRIGVEFDTPLRRRVDGTFSVLRGNAQSAGSEAQKA